jgi:hypothetical protein
MFPLHVFVLVMIVAVFMLIGVMIISFGVLIIHVLCFFKVIPIFVFVYHDLGRPVPFGGGAGTGSNK